MKEIGKEIFKGCSSLESVTFPNSLTEIGEKDFDGCYNIKNINVNADNEVFTSIDGILYDKSKTKLVKYPRSKGSSFSIPTMVREIEDGAFKECTTLQSITIPDSVAIIGSNAFAGCTALESITIPEYVTTIGERAFYGCNSLQSVVIPNSVTKIGNYAFFDCHNTVISKSNIYTTSVYSNSSFNPLPQRNFDTKIEVTTITKIYCQSQNPNTIDVCDTSFSSEIFEKCTLFIPSGTRWEYKHHPVFSKFKKIEIKP